MLIRGMPWLLGFLGLAVIASGVGVVYAKHLSRRHFVELQELRTQRDRLDTRWLRLQLEESTLATYSKVESDARNKLHMHIPVSGQVVRIPTH